MKAKEILEEWYRQEGNYDETELDDTGLLLRAVKEAQQIRKNDRGHWEGTLPTPTAFSVYIDDEEEDHADFLSNALLDTGKVDFYQMLGELIDVYVQLAAEVQGGLLDVRDFPYPEVYHRFYDGSITLEEFLREGVLPNARHRLQELEAIRNNYNGFDFSTVDYNDNKSLITRDLRGEFNALSAPKDTLLYHFHQAAIVLVNTVERFLQMSSYNQRAAWGEAAKIHRNLRDQESKKVAKLAHQLTTIILGDNNA